jgi:hypothetical protein
MSNIKKKARWVYVVSKVCEDNQSVASPVFVTTSIIFREDAVRLYIEWTVSDRPWECGDNIKIERQPSGEYRAERGGKYAGTFIVTGVHSKLR